MRVTEKGQVTIPKNVRRHLGIVPGSEVAFELRDGDALLRLADERLTADTSDAQRLIDHLRKHKGMMNLGGLTPDEFYRTLRD